MPFDEAGYLAEEWEPADPAAPTVKPNGGHPYSEYKAAEPARLASGNMFTLAALAEELPPIAWVCQGLLIAPGRPQLVAGYGYSGKTVALQAAALSIIAGKPVWGALSAAPGRVVHFDYELGRRMTLGRYQRLARGLGHDFSAHDPDDLVVQVYPTTYLDSTQAYDFFAKGMEGRSWAIVDSLRAAAPTADENKSEIRKYIDPLARASEATGCSTSLIVHANKPQQDKPVGKFSIRGSGAIYDACNSAFVFNGVKGKPVEVTQEKDGLEGSPSFTFGLRIEDIAKGEAIKWGLRVVHLEPEQLARTSSRVEEGKTKLLEFIKANPGCSENFIRAEMGGNKALLRECMDQLISDRKVHDTPPERSGLAHAYRAI